MAAGVVGNSASFGDLTSLDGDADDCMSAQQTGIDIANNCRSDGSPVATIYTDCGLAERSRATHLSQLSHVQPVNSQAQRFASLDIRVS